MVNMNTDTNIIYIFLIFTHIFVTENKETCSRSPLILPLSNKQFSSPINKCFGGLKMFWINIEMWWLICIAYSDLLSVQDSFNKQDLLEGNMQFVFCDSQLVEKKSVLNVMWCEVLSGQAWRTLPFTAPSHASTKTHTITSKSLHPAVKGTNR